MSFFSFSDVFFQMFCNFWTICTFFLVLFTLFLHVFFQFFLFSQFFDTNFPISSRFLSICCVFFFFLVFLSTFSSRFVEVRSVGAGAFYRRRSWEPNIKPTWKSWSKKGNGTFRGREHKVGFCTFIRYETLTHQKSMQNYPTISTTTKIII